MPSHCFMNTAATINPAELEQDIKVIIHNKFNDVFRIEPRIIKNEICAWKLVFDNVYNFPICLRAQNKIEFEHPDNYFSLWAQLTCEDELATKYNANMFDEEYPKVILKPNFKHHETFITFLETITLHHSPQWRKAVIAIELSYLPAELKAIIK